MAAFALIHGGGDVGWSWHLVEHELRRLGHRTVAPDLPGDDPHATLDDYADAVVDALAGHREPVVVGHSYGGFTAPLVAARTHAKALVMVAAMIPAPGETAADWWQNTGYGAAVSEQAARDGGMTGAEDPLVSFYHDVPRPLADEAVRRTADRDESEAAYNQPWPLPSWPAMPTRFIVCTEDRFFPAVFLRRVAAERLGITAEEIAAGHCVALSRPRELAAMLHRSAVS
ncbi:alpha/beta hydrolase [Microbacterium sp. Mu-80]|uniref:Alpha/beta hydrolase n=1 Tax=Microbacterium bandirmense TaxID=3122050 RepID=A0ABU8L6D1_9MICO